jgi:hypothetical protein
MRGNSVKKMQIKFVNMQIKFALNNCKSICLTRFKDIYLRTIIFKILII